ncbi:hypothetical protein OS175_04230 [Marinicella sp. S1101]|uniref:ORC-CDC6 family AAA ATPase n=1 Tax=Marinicella marina TaxID=2996016 RepID=UPI0022608309|nr:hypothetical protein [Marinicella marina]MCX7553075.1 hypothetical protein [Marinicella marina]
MSLDLSKNRAEEFRGKSYKHFIFPFYFNNIDLLSAEKTRVVYGGRGCGKTMLMEYFSYRSQFNNNSLNTNQEIPSIGIYWRADRSFSSLMMGRGKEEYEWAGAFQHHLSLSFAKEILASLKTIAHSSHSGLNMNDLNDINFSKLKAYDESIPGDLEGLSEHLEDQTIIFDSWLSNIYKKEEPIFFSGWNFISHFIELIRSSLKPLSETCFYILVDEYENLNRYQAEIINQYIKFSKNPLIFHISMKRNGFITQKATDSDNISRNHDYKDFDIEKLQYDNFEVFAAEILLNENIKQKEPLTVDGLAYDKIKEGVLTNKSRMNERLDQEYITSLKKIQNSIFAKESRKEQADNYIQKYGDRLKKKVSLRLKHLGYARLTDQMWDSNKSQAMIVLHALLSRNTINVEAIHQEFLKYKKGESSNFTGWIHTNFVGCYLSLFSSSTKTCPIYSGFENFTKIAAGNMRHFLGLANEALRTNESVNDRSFPVPIQVQCISALNMSDSYLNEIKSLGDYGHLMHSFTLKLGLLFNLAHKRASQSEPEQTHFSFPGGIDALTLPQQKLFRELVKYTVLIESNESKTKNKQVNMYEYRLNPIYSPSFMISYRKIRKLSLQIEDVSIMLDETKSQEFLNLKTRFERKWDAESTFELDLFHGS